MMEKRKVNGSIIESVNSLTNIPRNAANKNISIDGNMVLVLDRSANFSALLWNNNKIAKPDKPVSSAAVR